MAVKPDKKMIKRGAVIMVAVILCLTVVSSVSLVNIMIIKGENYQSKASEQQLYDSLLTAPRGNIYDKNMNLLATSATAWTVYVMPNSINKLKDAEKAERIREIISNSLASILDMTSESIAQKLNQSSYYVIIKKRVDKDVADKVREIISDNKDYELSKYLGLDETTKRYYPNDSLASCVLGFVGDDNQGLDGLEKQYDNELTGVAGRVVAAKNAKGTDMPFTYEKVEEAKRGNSLVLTIDSYVQYVCEKYLDVAVEENNIAERGAVIAMNVNTGAILGMAVSGDFNPNSPFVLSAADQAKVDAAPEGEKKELRNELLNRQWRNKAVSDTYEPGSVFKIFTASTALEEGLVSLKSSFTCNYTFVVAGNAYHCHHSGGHGTQSLSQAISNSCNPAFIQIGQLIGSNMFSKYFKAFGMAEKTGIDLPGEASPTYHREDKMGPTELASSSFGQTFNVTPIQMITMAAAAVNGGYLVKPHLVERIVDSDNKVVETVSTEYKRQVVSESTSKTMRTLLEFVVQNGAKNGIVPGYRVGGKTGTSQKMVKIVETGDRGYYIGSYVGIVPINDPQIAIYVMLDEPKGRSYYGGVISAPVGSRVMSDILPYLGIEPKYSETELKHISVSVPDVTGNALVDAKKSLSGVGLSYKVIGSGDKVLRQHPTSGNSVFRGGTVILYTEDTEAQTTTVPNLLDKTANEVNSAAASAGVNVEFSGNVSAPSLKSYRQSISPGTQVPIGQIVTVYFRDEATVDLAD
ncbi:MAG: PASTA domain-containing protein [Clostridia bacterium]|nr:PASTA domain-containing protein [Clostridia bacterium]